MSTRLFFRRAVDGWEWLVAGGLALTSSVALLTLLVTLAQMQDREGRQAAGLAAGAGAQGAVCGASHEANWAAWLSTEVASSQGPLCACERRSTLSLEDSVLGTLCCEAAQVTTGYGTADSGLAPVRLGVSAAAVVLAWVLGVWVIVRPLYPSHCDRRPF
jgi:hypothetical protein